ncbi:NADH:ubiquinone oxidoreductase [Vibrio sp. ZSDZ34]|jgi:hypothetical protein|uniref:NADH:ubiquinone oxidoreductase n=1 Tax=Vibrio gelatinilyticus TaxID=2893468 RepID=A0A9X1WBU4_9VIBR|nr:NADH:ubiquinone oxidoreductase [Vibrio gelatinilyticus]MCJ2377196.1 NADH:ubiquinone oxidoreductase [Vibrio gelatinilyticus]
MFIPKIVMLLGFSIGAGWAAADHIHSYMLGLSIASLAVGACYFIAFFSSRFPELSLFLLLCGAMAKLTITVVGIALSISHELITSPIVFSLSYLFYTIVVSYLWFSYKDARTIVPKLGATSAA